MLRRLAVALALSLTAAAPVAAQEAVARAEKTQHASKHARAQLRAGGKPWRNGTTLQRRSVMTFDLFSLENGPTQKENQSAGGAMLPPAHCPLDFRNVQK